MTKPKNLGIWMDHSTANLMEFTTTSIKTQIIKSQLAFQDKEPGIMPASGPLQKKNSNQQLDYFGKLSDVILNYDAVILFGPTDAKVELYNILKADDRFGNIAFKIKQTGKMTENQQHAFVKEHFLSR